MLQVLGVLMEFSWIHLVIIIAAIVVGIGIKYIIPDQKVDVVIEKAAETVIKQETGINVDLSVGADPKDQKQ